MAHSNPDKDQDPPNDQQKSLQYYSTQSIAKTTISDPEFEPYNLSRHISPNNGHTLTGRTWNTPDTITHILSCYRRGSPLNSPLDTSPSTRPELRRFYTFGHGLNAHPNLLHGGVIAVILDSTMGGAVGMALQGSARPGAHFTAQLNVKYEKPVVTPGTVVVKAWVVKVEGEWRKVWVEAVVEGGEKGEVRHAKAEGLWIKMKGKL